MAYQISKQRKPQFLMGINSPEQLQAWLDEHRDVKGLCFVGRSNVGKSSLVNALFGQKTARTSKTPGRTRQVNIFEFHLDHDQNKNDSLGPFFFIDLPGYGHAKVSKSERALWDHLIDLVFREIPVDFLICHIQDARHPMQEIDLFFSDYIKKFSFPTELVFNKIDKLKTQKERSALNKEKSKIFKTFTSVRTIHFISAEKGSGLDALKNSISDYLSAFYL